MEPDANEDIYKARNLLYTLKYLLIDNPEALQPDTGFGLAIMIEAAEERLTRALQKVGGDPDTTHPRKALN